MSIQTNNQELSVDERRILLKPVAKAIEAKHEDISKALNEPMLILFEKEDKEKPAYIYNLFMKSLLLLMTIPENSAFMKKNFGDDALSCFDNLLFFFDSLEHEPVNEWVDYTMCNQFYGGMNPNDIELLRNKYLKDES